ncbi:MAG: RNA polymerase sigma factor [Parcubacteria group bacterium]|nr:RNA polymerase sigma factor [Parcubacteria group bacterium]
MVRQLTINMKERFSKAYDEHVSSIYRFCYLKVGSRDIAEDLSSEVFLRFWKQLNSSRIDNDKAFLYGIARNVIADHYRKRHTPSVSLEGNVLNIAADPYLADIAAVSSDMEQVRKALSELNDEYQNLVIWHYLDELSISEIAKIEEKSEESVRVQLHRALNQLRDRLQEV